MASSNAEPKKLDREEFADALRKGLGRALIHVKHYGLDGVEDLVVEACTHNQVYDPQCEPSRAVWLFDMFKDSPHYAVFQSAILQGLSLDITSRNLGQILALIKEMAAHGDDLARSRMKERVFEIAGSSDGDYDGAEEWIELEGANGLLDLARIYGQRLLDDSNVWFPHYLPHPDGQESVFTETLRLHANQEPALKAYWNYLETNGAFDPPSPPISQEARMQSRREQVRKQSNLESILRDAKNKRDQYPGRYMSFGRHATPEELESIYRHLLEEKDEEVILRLLWVFRRAPIPYPDEALFGWIESKNDLLRASVITALAQITNERVHALAQKMVQPVTFLRHSDDEVLKLFVKNYALGDASLITQALASKNPGEDREAHNWGYAIIEIAEAHDDPALAAPLIWTYHNTPCTNCRDGALKELHRRGRLNTDLIAECQFDCVDEVREFAHGLLRQDRL